MGEQVDVITRTILMPKDLVRGLTLDSLQQIIRRSVHELVIDVLESIDDEGRKTGEKVIA